MLSCSRTVAPLSMVGVLPAFVLLVHVSLKLLWYVTVFIVSPKYPILSPPSSLCSEVEFYLISFSTFLIFFLFGFLLCCLIMGLGNFYFESVLFILCYAKGLLNLLVYNSYFDFVATKRGLFNLSVSLYYLLCYCT